MYECFTVDITDHIAHVVMNRPDKRNSMTVAFWDELPAIIEDIDDGAKARVIVLSSTGPHFTSGIDVSLFGPDNDLLEPESDNPFSERQDENCRLPVLVAIQGGCIGGGVDLVTACDMRYATEDAFLTIFETNIGMTADVGTFPRLVKLIPEGIVRELAYTGRRMPAAEAQATGLVNRVFPDHASLVAGVMEIAAEIARKAPLAVYGCKRIINYARDHTTADGLDYIGVWNASMLQLDEIREAMAAGQEQRAGRFAELPPRRRRADR